MMSQGEEIDKLEVTLKVDFKKEDGPFVKALDNALASFHVKKQAYYSGTFVEDYPPLCSEARAIIQKYLSFFYLFQKCHNIYDKNIVSDEEIEQLEDSIGAFMAFYRKNFATHSVLPKMHFLEVHVVPYLKQWHMGFGFMVDVERTHSAYCSIECCCKARDKATQTKLTRDKQELSMAEMGLLEVDGRITFSKTVAFACDPTLVDRIALCSLIAPAEVELPANLQAVHCGWLAPCGGNHLLGATPDGGVVLAGVVVSLLGTRYC
eukprot:Em0004g17a